MTSTKDSGKQKAFTLIELLIVVAIIAILAAIAVPNFLEAQTRAKVSRVVADMRTIQVGLESYAVDNNKYPREYRSGFYAQDAQINGQAAYAVPFTGLSTPISYLSNAWLVDPFVQQSEVAPFDAMYKYIRYYDLAVRNNPPYLEFYGPYRMLSYGPDRDFNLGGNQPQIMYDSSNGTISIGNIWRSQKNNGKQPIDDGVLVSPH